MVAAQALTDAGDSDRGGVSDASVGSKASDASAWALADSIVQERAVPVLKQKRPRADKAAYSYWKWSSSRPGVATMKSAPFLNAFSWGPMPMPP